MPKFFDLQSIRANKVERMRNYQIPLLLIAGFVILGLMMGCIQVPEGAENKTSSEKATFSPNMDKINSIKGVLEEYLKLTPGGGNITLEYKSAELEDGMVVITFKSSQGELKVYTDKEYKYLLSVMRKPPTFSEMGTQLQMIKKQIEMQEKEQKQEMKEMPKTEKPKVELFVMSYCPFGLQMEKGILPVVKLLGDKIDFEVKFVNYAMHGKKEIDENTRQYCIEKTQKEKYIHYLECFLEDGNYESCLDEAGIDKEELESCISQTDEEYNITNLYNDRSTWLNGRYPMYPIHDSENKQYAVRGSPTLVINGKQVSSGRAPSMILQSICNAFETQPEECSQELSSETPSPGLGYGTTGGGATGSCG